MSKLLYSIKIALIQNQIDEVDTWSQSQAYQSSLRNILAVNVVKDSAEQLRTWSKAQL